LNDAEGEERQVLSLSFSGNADPVSSWWVNRATTQFMDLILLLTTLWFTIGNSAQSP